MKRETYIALQQYFHARPYAARFICAANTWVTRFVYAAYPCWLIWLFFTTGWQTALKALLIPAIGFCLLTVLRKAVNAPRPYEVFEASPIIPKNTSGLSFPSRHTFSIFVIATTMQICSPVAWVGPVALCLACVLAVLRVLGGVHFPRDVIAGALLGAAIGAIELLF